MSERFLPFHVPAIGDEEIESVVEAIKSGWLTMGPKTAEFEEAFARYVEARHAIAVSSCTAALHLALEAVGLQAGDEVLVPTTTFTATAEVVVYFNAQPVLVDIAPATMNMDPDAAARKITSRTKAIVPVHFAGQPCDMEALHSLANRYGLRVIEDAAHALPARYASQTIGSLSELTAFSFYATKTLAIGEGGMITTDNPELASRMRVMRLHGISKDAWKRYSAEGSWYYEVEEAGFKYNMTDVQAALGLAQLAKCDANWQARQRIAQRYTQEFSTIEELEPPRLLENRESAWHLYVLRLRLEKLGINRDRFIEELKKRGIGASVHFIPLHLHPYYQRRFGYKEGDFPQAEQEYRRCLSLPIFPTMRSKDVERVISVVGEIALENAN